jgi:hypothetical protein
VWISTPADAFKPLSFPAIFTRFDSSTLSD